VTYKMNDTVPEDGEYLCIACGNITFFTKGDRFPTCDECGAGTADGPGGFDESASEFWRKL